MVTCLLLRITCRFPSLDYLAIALPLGQLCYAWVLGVLGRCELRSQHTLHHSCPQHSWELGQRSRLCCLETHLSCPGLAGSHLWFPSLLLTTTHQGPHRHPSGRTE